MRWNLPAETDHVSDRNQCTFAGRTDGVCDCTADLLENAIEAEELEEDKLIELQIYESAGLLLVTVRNRISQSVMENNPELRTRKADASLHGLGRKSVKKLIRDMEGSFYEEERNGFFISNIVV
ncbi:GHKL domain-containing protein [Clostridium sp. AF43-10]|nr:GHKL domain-containing protein [Clostridium sp. AF43-10]